VGYFLFEISAETGIPFFFKQWGGVRKKEAGRKLNGRTYDERPARQYFPIPSADECAARIAKIESHLLNEMDRVDQIQNACS
jgi:hypothetical protein